MDIIRLRTIDQLFQLQAYLKKTAVVDRCFLRVKNLYASNEKFKKYITMTQRAGASLKQSKVS